MTDRSSATYPASARRQHPDPGRSIARSSATPATLVLTVWIIGRCGLEDRSASRKGTSIKPGRAPEPDRVCKAPQAIDLQVPEFTIPGIAQLPHQRRFLISCLIPGVLVQTLSHPLRSSARLVVTITTSCRFSGQFPCPFVQASNDPRSNPDDGAIRCYQRKLYGRSTRRFRLRCQSLRRVTPDPMGAALPVSPLNWPGTQIRGHRAGSVGPVWRRIGRTARKR